MVRTVLVLLLFLVGCGSSQMFTRTPQTDLLCNRDYSKIIIEVSYIDKIIAPPTKSDLEYLRKKVQEKCYKNVVYVVVDKPAPVTSLVTLLWDETSLKVQEGILAKFRSAGDTLVIHILYMPGIESCDTTTIGLAYDSFSFVILTNKDGPMHERHTLLHEFSHLIAIPGKTATNYDKRHPYHCSNLNCVVHWCSDGSQAPGYCNDCENLIKEHGGK